MGKPEISMEVRNLVKEFPADALFRTKARILDDITFNIEMGDNLALIGPNGCGKTTLLKTLSTIYLPDQGTIKVHGMDINTNLKQVRNMMSFVSPALSFQNKLTLRETLDFFGKVLNKPFTNVEPFLKKMEIEHMMDVKLEGFSEGQKGMVRLAIGLIKDPRLLLLDEVVANLDVDRKSKVLDYLEEQDRARGKELGLKRGITMCMVDHDPSVVDRLCDKILILNKGGTVFKLTTVEELIKSLPYKYDVNVVFKEKVKEDDLTKMWKDHKQYTRMVRFFAQDKKEALEITDQLLDNENVLEFSTSGISLEDVYFLMMENDLDGLKSAKSAMADPDGEITKKDLSANKEDRE